MIRGGEHVEGPREDHVRPVGAQRLRGQVQDVVTRPVARADRIGGAAQLPPQADGAGHRVRDHLLEEQRGHEAGIALDELDPDLLAQLSIAAEFGEHADSLVHEACLVGRAQRRRWPASYAGARGAKVRARRRRPGRAGTGRPGRRSRDVLVVQPAERGAPPVDRIQETSDADAVGRHHSEPGDDHTLGVGPGPAAGLFPHEARRSSRRKSTAALFPPKPKALASATCSSRERLAWAT